MKILYGILLLTVAMLSCQHNTLAAGDSLGLAITLDKGVYKKSDPISIDFKLKNNGKSAIYINKRFQINSKESPADEREIYLKIIAPSGKELSYKASYGVGLPKSDYFVLLEPGAEAGMERAKGIKHLYDFDEPGKYTITAVYRNACGKEIGVSAFNKKITSNTVTIEIEGEKKVSGTKDTPKTPE